MSDLIEVTCDNCGKMLRVPKNRAGQNGKCAYCGESVYIPIIKETQPDFSQKNKKRQAEYAIPKALSSASYQKPSYQKTSKKSHIPIISFCIFIFILGNATGYIFSEQIGSFFGNSNVPNANNSIVYVNSSSKVNNDSSSKANNSSSTDIVDLSPKNSETTVSNTLYDKKTQQNLEEAKEYIDELKRELSSIEKISAILATRYNVNLGEDFYQILDSSHRQLKQNEEIYIGVQKKLSNKEITNSQQINAQLKKIVIDNILILKTVKTNKEKIQSKLNKYSKNAPKKKKISTKYMGRWYIDLLKNIKKIEKAYRKVNITTQSANMKYSAIKNEIKKIKYLSRDVKKAAKSLEEKINQGKDPYDWVKQRRANARSIPQKKQADILEEFINKNKKFYVDIRNEFNILLNYVNKLDPKNETRLLAETNLRNILKSLQAIYRQCEETYQLLDSAILNFTIKEE